MKVKVALATAATVGNVAWSALWTFPSMLLSAFLVAWAAEAAQFLIAQGLALAILAWIQTLPELAVEAVIAWQAGHDPVTCFVAAPPSGCRSHLAIANFTGAVRLLVGVGWPLIYFVSALGRRRNGRALEAIQLHDEHSVEIIATVPPLVYFVWIWHKGAIGIADAVVLVAMYVAYLAMLWRFPPKDEEAHEHASAVSRWAYTRPGRWQPITIGTLFLFGGALIYLTAHPFLDSMLAVAATFGVSEFVFVQWVAPFLSEFPEKVSAFHWAKRVRTAPMALMNMVSSNVNQWTVLAATIPIVFSTARGGPASLPLDPTQRMEILLTIVQSAVAALLLARMRLTWWDATGLFVLWLVQFVVAEWREEVAAVYALWALALLVSWLWKRPAAPRIFWDLMRGRRPLDASPAS